MRLCIAALIGVLAGTVARAGDGELTADEVNRVPWLKKRFEGADTNGDGLLTVDGKVRQPIR